MNDTGLTPELKYLQQRGYYDALLIEHSATPFALLVGDDLRVVQCSGAFLELLGGIPENWRGKPLHTLCPALEERLPGITAMLSVRDNLPLGHSTVYESRNGSSALKKVPNRLDGGCAFVLTHNYIADVRSQNGQHQNERLTRRTAEAV